MIENHRVIPQPPIRVFIPAVCLIFSCFVFINVCPAENAVSLGYGFGAWNGCGTGRIEQKAPYDYATFSYLYEKPFASAIALVFEPFLNLVNRPDYGLDAGFNVYAKAYVPEFSPGSRLYFTAGTGMAYTTVQFKEQGTHGLFILQGGIGYRAGRFFIENRLHHYSNGGLAKPNRSVNSNLVMIGCYF